MLKGLSRSLSLRLLGIFIALAALFVWGTFSALRWVYNSDEIRGLISGHLSLHVSYVRKDIGSPPRIDRALSITRRVPVDIRLVGPDLDWASDAEFPSVDELEFGPSEFFSDAREAWVDELQGVEFAVKDGHRFLKMGAGDYDVIVASPRISDEGGTPDILLIILGLGLFYLLLGYIAVSWLFKPIRAIRAGAAHIGCGNFDYRIENIRSDQLGDLAADINQLADDVESMLNAKRALLLGISHELRTPLSRMNLVTELMENDDDRSLLKPEIAEMDKIVATLLEAERLSTRHDTLTRSPLRIRELVESLVNDFFSRDRGRLEIDMQAPDRIVDVDEARILLLLKNLVSNALRYSKDGEGLVGLEVREEGGDLVFLVSDDGPGIPSEFAAQIGEPFYRGGPSRNRGTGGTGLGLHIATLVAKAHGGSLKLLNPGQAGAIFEVRIPI